MLLQMVWKEILSINRIFCNVNGIGVTGATVYKYVLIEYFVM